MTSYAQLRRFASTARARARYPRDSRHDAALQGSLTHHGENPNGSFAGGLVLCGGNDHQGTGLRQIGETRCAVDDVVPMQRELTGERASEVKSLGVSIANRPRSVRPSGIERHRPVIGSATAPGELAEPTRRIATSAPCATTP